MNPSLPPPLPDKYSLNRGYKEGKNKNIQQKISVTIDKINRCMKKEIGGFPFFAEDPLCQWLGGTKISTGLRFLVSGVTELVNYSEIAHRVLVIIHRV